jgi:hypothetical protein
MHPDLRSGIEHLQRACPATHLHDDEAPIFLLSAGWRSGSTLLQRLIMSDSRVLIWGEPYDECGLIQVLTSAARAFRAGWPPAEYFYDGRPPHELSGDWIANLFPGLQHFRNGHRALLDKMFSEPARLAGVSRWGIKEVRLGSDHGFYLRWLYPNARFVVLYRNPLDAYRSYSQYGRCWYDTFPDKPVFTPTAFGTHWRRLMEGFLRDAGSLNALLVRYEDLVGEHPPLDDIDAHLGIRTSRSVLREKVRGAGPDGKKVPVSRAEKWLLRRAVSPVAAELGYSW